MYKSIVLLSCMFIAMTMQGQDLLISTDSTSFPPLELNEVRVISSKEIRNNKVVELPSAVSVLDNLSLQHENVTSLGNISALVPNLFMPDYGTKLTSPVYMRGIGSRINSPSVGLYVDNVPYFEKAVFDFDFYDIERIEVLRGPQGTLYGRNTMGGIINIYTREPGKTPETGIELEAGSFNHYKMMLKHSRPLSENTTMSLNLSGFNYGGYYENEYDSSMVDQMKSLSASLKIKTDISRHFKAGYSMNAEYSNQNGYPYAEYIDSTQSAGDINYDYQSGYDRLMVSNNIQLKYFTEKLSLISNTSYQYFDGYQDIDQDFTSRQYYGVVQDQEQHMISQEITLNSQQESSFSYMAGLFAFTQILDSKVNVDYKDDLRAILGYPDPYTKYKSYDNQTSGIAFFLQSTISDFIVEGLDVIQGIRFDSERAGQDYSYNLDSMGMNLIDQFDYHLDFFKILPKLAFSYQCAPNINTYATIAAGYKTGGFNTTIEREEDESFLPEESVNYEFGVKSDFFNHKITANLAFFYIDWTNQQIYQTVPSGTGSMIKNAGHSYSKGIEAEFNLIPLDRLRLFSNFGLTEAKFIEYEKDSATSYSGNYIPYVPRVTLHVGANYSQKINSDILKEINYQISYKAFGKHYWREDNLDYQDYYGLLNARISFENQFLGLSFWGKNILNEEYNSFFFKTSRSFVQPGRPVSLGVSLRVKI